MSKPKPSRTRQSVASGDKQPRPQVSRVLVGDAHPDWQLDPTTVEEIGQITGLQGQGLEELIAKLKPAIDFARAMRAVDHEAPEQSGRITVALQSLITKLEPALYFARDFLAADADTPEEVGNVTAALQGLIAILEPAVQSSRAILAAEATPPSEISRNNYRKRETLTFLITWLQGRALQGLIIRLQAQATLEELVAMLEAAIDFASSLDVGDAKSPLVRDIGRALRPVKRALDRGDPPDKLWELLLRQDDKKPWLSLWERVGRGDLAANVTRFLSPQPHRRPFSLAAHCLIHDVHTAMSEAGLRTTSYVGGPFVQLTTLCFRIAGIQKAKESESVLILAKHYLRNLKA